MASGEIGQAHVSLRLTLDQFERNLNLARATTVSAADKMAMALKRVELQNRSLELQSRRLDVAQIRLEQSARRAAAAQLAMANSASRAGVGILALSRQFLVLSAVASAVPAALGVRAFAQYADAATNLSARLNVLTGSTSQAAILQAELFRVSQRARAPIEELTEVFLRLSRATEGLGLSQAATLSVTESLGKLLAISGARSEEASGAFIQLTQSFARGELRGQELNSVYEQFPVLLDIIAKQSGITTRALIADAIQNGLSVDKIINGLIEYRGEIDKQFAKMPVTIDQALVTLGNSLQRSIGLAAASSDGYKGLTDALVGLSDQINSPEFQTGVRFILDFLAEAARRAATTMQELGMIVQAFTALKEAIVGRDFGGILSANANFMADIGKASGEIEKIGTAATGAAEDIRDDLIDAFKELQNEGFIAAVQLNQGELLGAFQKEFDWDRLIAPESVVNALKKLAGSGFDVTQAFDQWPSSVHAAFASLVEAEEATRRLNSMLESQKENLKTLTDAHKEYAQSRTQDIDALIAKGEEEHEKWLEKKKEEAEELKRIEEERKSRIESSGRLPDDIDMANIAASELASTLSDLSNLSFDSLSEAFIEINQQIVQAIIQALIFRGIMAAIGGATGGAGTSSGFVVDPFVPSSHGRVLRKMAHGGFITNRPMIMPMDTGAALIGEAGPEAVLPLKRMASGNLGVASDGSGGSRGNEIHIDARQSTPGTTMAAVAAATKHLAPISLVNAEARGLVPKARAPF